jgi:hypothetical protein
VSVFTCPYYHSLHCGKEDSSICQPYIEFRFDFSSLKVYIGQCHFWCRLGWMCRWSMVN